MSYFISLVRKYAAVPWTIAAAVSVELFVPMRWWHPYCDIQGDGPGYYGVGFPLPYERPSGASSLTVFFMPHIYLLDLIIVAGIAYVLAAPVIRRLTTRTTLSNVVAIVGSALLVAVAGLQILSFAVSEAFEGPYGWFDSYDSPLSYRPALIALWRGNKPCEM